MARRLGSMESDNGYDPPPDHFQVKVHHGRFFAPLSMPGRQLVFVCSMGDLFHEQVTDNDITRLFTIMALAKKHTYQVLTKRAERMRDFMQMLTSGGREGNRLLAEALDWIAEQKPRTEVGLWARMSRPTTRKPRQPVDNIWLGVSVEDQQRADERIPLLLQTPAAVRFVSCEPLLGEVRLDYIDADDATWWAFDGSVGVEGRGMAECGKVHWVIAGCESGPKRRPCDHDWLRSLRDQCASAGVPYFLKQMEVRGKLVEKPALDGTAHVAFPEAAKRKAEDDISDLEVYQWG
jgi:protein gp37